jgi:hypothetical protein
MEVKSMDTNTLCKAQESSGRDLLKSNTKEDSVFGERMALVSKFLNKDMTVTAGSSQQLPLLLLIQKESSPSLHKMLPLLMELTNLSSGLMENQSMFSSMTDYQFTIGLTPLDTMQITQLSTTISPMLEPFGYKSLRKPWLNLTTTTLVSTEEPQLKP